MNTATTTSKCPEAGSGEHLWMEGQDGPATCHHCRADQAEEPTTATSTQETCTDGGSHAFMTSSELLGQRFRTVRKCLTCQTLTPATTEGHAGEVIETGAYLADMGHRPVCACGWVGPLYPLGHLDRARAALRDHA